MACTPVGRHTRNKINTSNKECIMFREHPLTLFPEVGLLATSSLSRAGDSASVPPGRVEVQGPHMVSLDTMAGRRAHYHLQRVKVLASFSDSSDATLT